MKKVVKNIIVSLLGASLATSVGVALAQNSKADQVSAYSTSSLPTTIDLNDTSASNIRSYYSSLNNLSQSERQGTNLLKNLKTILKNGQKYYSYDSGNAIWQIYEIADRDWAKSPASSTSYGTYDSGTNKITNYQYGTSSSSSKNNPYIHALYINRNVTNKTTAWDNHNQDEWGINREHVWPKAEGFETSAAGGARGDPMHLMAGNGYSNNIHSNYYYGYVNTSSSYTDCGDKYSNQSGNLRGTSKTLNTGTVFEPQDCDKGDIARAIFYMVARYNYLSGSDSDGIDSNNPNLTLTQNMSDWASSGYVSTTSNPGKMGVMTDLLAWHHADPVDEYEIHRNNLLFTNYTNNRNPFIDFPEWVDFIWGTATYSGTTYKSYDSTPTGYATPSSDTINGYNGGGGSTEATGVSLNKNTVSLAPGSSETLTTTITPANGTYTSISWSSSNTSAATVANGVVSIPAGATENDQSTITVTLTTASNTYTDTCVVTVSSSGGGGGSGSKSIIYNDTFSPTLPADSASIHTTNTSHTDSTCNLTFEEQGIYKGASSSYIMFELNKGFLFNTQDLGTIDSVSVTYSSQTSTSGKIGVYFGNSEQSTYTTTNNQTIKGQSQTDVFENSTEGYGYFQVSSSNKRVQITQIAIEYHESSPSEPTLDSIAVKTAPTITSYSVGDDFNPNGLVITATYVNPSSTEDVPYKDNEDLFDFDPINNLQTSDVSVTITYGGKTCSQAISVTVPKTLSSIAVSSAPTKTTYNEGEYFDPTGLVIRRNYSDSTYDTYTYADHTSDFSFTPSTATVLTTSDVSVTITYGGKSTTQAITVNAKTLSSIAVETAPTKTTYIEGDHFDPTGLVITRNYSDSSSDTYTYAGHTSEFAFSPSTSTALTTSVVSVSITYGGQTTSQTIKVNASGTATEEGSVTAASGALEGWTAEGTGSAYADGSVKFDGSGDNVYKLDIFTGDASDNMINLEVTINSKINGTPTSANSYKVEALDSSGNVLASDTKTGADIVTTSYGDAVFTMSSNLSGCTGIRITYVTKGGGNWGVKQVSWVATYSTGGGEVTSITASVSKTFYVGETISASDITVKDNNNHTVSGFTFANDGYRFTYSDAASGGSLTDKTFTNSISYSTFTCSLTVRVQRKAYGTPETSSVTLVSSSVFSGIGGGSSNLKSGTVSYGGITYDYYKSYYYSGGSSISFGNASALAGYVKNQTAFATGISDATVTSSGRAVNIRYSVDGETWVLKASADPSTYDYKYIKVDCIGNTGTNYSNITQISITLKGEETPNNVANYIMFEDSSGQCVSKYDVAKDYFESMSKANRVEFMESTDYVISTARERLIAWAKYHGNVINASGDDYIISRNIIPFGSFVDNDNSKIIAIVSIVSLIGVSAIGGYFFLKKRKEQ